MDREVFILGSGFSKALHSSMPTLQELSRQVHEAFGAGWDPDWHGELRDNVELLLTYLAAHNPWEDPAQRHEGLRSFYDVRDLVIDLIEQAQVDVSSDLDDPPSWLVDLVNYWHNNRATVITFNYDVLVERAASEVLRKQGKRRPPSDLYPVAIMPLVSRWGGGLYGGQVDNDTFTLLKPHGSLSWYFSGPDSPPGDVVYGSTAVGWEKIAPEDERLVGDKQRLVVPPLLEKTAFYANDVLRRQWSLARHAIEQAELVTCIGYSLPETDLTARFLLSTATPSLDVEVVDKNGTDVERRYRRLLPGFNPQAHHSGEHAIADYVATLA